jgi:hypothetical protein
MARHYLNARMIYLSATAMLIVQYQTGGRLAGQDRGLEAVRC